MNVIKQSDPKIIGTLGGPQIKVSGRYYRFNKYLLQYKYDEETILILNNFTGAFISLKQYELDNLFTDNPCNYADYCVQNYFIVYEEFDEDFWINEFRNRNKLPITKTCLDHVHTFTILPTTTCNARCPYCYEKNLHHKQNMSKEMAEKVAKFILDTYDYNSGGLSLSWFGGEPLFNTEVIDIISNRINGFGYKFNASIITNGYLLNRRNIEQCINEWHINTVQITLDGINDKYNKIKNYIYKDDPNPFETVIYNIKELIKNKINVSIRMNMDNSNYEDIKELLIYLCEEFKNNPNRRYMSMYVNRMYFLDESIEYFEVLANNLLDLEQIIKNNGFYAHHLYGGIKINHCQVDSLDGVMIFPNGDIGLCQGTLENRMIGHIDKPGDYNLNMIKKLQQMEDKQDICKYCVIKPSCVNLKCCTSDHKICNEPIQDYIIRKTIMEMCYEYEMYLEHCKNNQKNNCQNNNCQPQSNCSQNNQVWKDTYEQIMN